ncbi:MAG: ATPase domain-containing protein [Candidatus Thorarchaeota archaeon]
MSPRIEEGGTTGIAIALTVAEEVIDVVGLFRDIFLNVAGDGVTELAKWVWARYQRRSKGKNAKKIIEDISKVKQLNTTQLDIFKKLPDHLKKADSEIRRKLASGIEWEPLLVDWMEENGFGNRQLASEIVSGMIHDLREIVIQTVSPQEIYRQALEHGVQLLELQDMILDEMKRVKQAYGIGLSLPLDFKPLSTVLGQDIVAEKYKRFIEEQSVKLPEPLFFRRPRIEWTDIDEKCVYVREKVLDDITEGFSKNHIQLLMGEPGAGKTLLGFVIGYQRIKLQNSPVFYLDFLEHRVGTLDLAVRELILDLQGMSQDSCLLIIDNVHTNTRLASKLFQSLVSHWNIDVLFIARVESLEVTNATDSLHAEISGTGTSKEYLGTYCLRTQAFNDAVFGITKTYFDYFLLDHDVKLVADYLSKKCQGNLWLLTFYLNAIVEDKSDELDLSSIDICQELTAYYLSESINFRIQDESSVYELVRDAIDKRLDDREKRLLLIGILRSIAITSRIDVPFPSDFLDVFISPDKLQPSLVEDQRIQPRELRNIVSQIITKLQKLGELVKLEKFGLPHTMFPHSTLAVEIIKCISEPDFVQGNFEEQYIEILNLYARRQFVAEKLLFALLPNIWGLYPGNNIQGATKFVDWIRNNIALLSISSSIHREILERYVLYQIILKVKLNEHTLTRIYGLRDDSELWKSAELRTLNTISVTTNRASINFRVVQSVDKIDRQTIEAYQGLVTDLKHVFLAVIIHSELEKVQDLEKEYNLDDSSRLRLFSSYGNLSTLLNWIECVSDITIDCIRAGELLKSDSMNAMAWLFVSLGNIVARFEFLSRGGVDYTKEIRELEIIHNEMREMIKDESVTNSDVEKIIASLISFENSLG